MTPTEHQRYLFENRAPKPKRGLDRFADGWLGRFRRGPWALQNLIRQAGEISVLRESLSALGNGEINEKIMALKMSRRRKPDDWQEVLVPGLALLAVAAERELSLRAYEVQLMASAALVTGHFAEVDTGEGKTLSIGLAAAFHALSGQPCHVITANDYLAGRDARNLERFYQRVGLSVAAIAGESDDDARKKAYRCGVTYATAKEVAADYLRDRIRVSGAEVKPARFLAALLGERRIMEPVQRGLHATLIDEADHALIDEAVTPLIISRTLEAGEMELASRAAWALADSFEQDIHYRVDRPRRLIEMLAPGVDDALHRLDLPKEGLWASSRRRVELTRQAVEAREFFLKDEHYVVDDGKIVIVDPATGRPMPMRTWQQGLHQIIEAKEDLAVTGSTETMARISFQAYFRKYRKLAGASGTLKEAADELWHTYHVPFVRIPRHLPCRRSYIGTRFLPDQKAQHKALVQEISVRHARGQPVLIGTRTVETSEEMSGLLHEHHLPVSDQVLNARRHREEAVLVSQAGQRSRMTIATSMAGRGTDIELGHGVDILGGLHVVAAEIHESARVDRQLFGRAARQGDPGSVISLFSADDPVLKRFIPATILKIWSRALSNAAISPLSQWCGRVLLRWAQYRAQYLAAKLRRRVTLSEVDIERSLGFTMGRARGISLKRPSRFTSPRVDMAQEA